MKVVRTGRLNKELNRCSSLTTYFNMLQSPLTRMLQLNNQKCSMFYVYIGYQFLMTFHTEGNEDGR